MPDDSPSANKPFRTPAPLKPVEILGDRAIALLTHIGGATMLLLDALRWCLRSLLDRKIRLGRHAIIEQVVRVGVRSIFIVCLVSGVVGMILAIQLAPPLDEFGRRDLVANIIGVAVLRELGPLIGAIVLTGFAGAAIAAEIGTMVVGEEIEALEAHALNPIRFLVLPRVIAACASMTALGVFASLVAIIAALVVSITLLGIPYEQFMFNLLDQAKLADFVSGFIKGGVFGLLIGVIACYNGLKVTGGAAGVGNATTYTVVQCVVAIIFADLVATAMFFALGFV
ncbi:MAG: ABC transporter permease [Planctomycetota bacterium]